jgi:hypothetical protein
MRTSYSQGESSLPGCSLVVDVTEQVAMSSKVCLRCDWDGETNGSACPNCGVPLYVIGAPRKPKAGNDPVEPSHHAEPPDEPQGERTSRTGPPEPAAATFARWAGAFVVAALLLTVAFDAWLRSDDARPSRAASPDPTVDNTTAGLASPRDLRSPTERVGQIANVTGREPCTRRCRADSAVGGVPFSFRVPTRGWERFGDISINKSIVGPQGAEAIIYWTSIPGDFANPCVDVLGMPVPRSADDLAAEAATAPGTEVLAGPSNVRVGGLPAKHVARLVHEDFGCDPGFFFIWNDVEAGALWPATEAGHTISVWVVEVRQAPIFIAAVTSKQANDRLQQEIGMIVTSIRFDA